MVQSDMVLCQELAKQTENLQHVQEMEEVPDIEIGCADDDDAAEEPLTKQPRASKFAQTLPDILKAAGFSAYGPSDDDCELHLFGRIQKLRPFMHAFAIVVRSEEKIISKASVLGKLRPLNEQQQFEHDMSLAREEFHCSASRQSRHALWCDYGGRLLEAVRGGLGEEAPDPNHIDMPFQEIKALTPSSYLSGDGSRVCQLLVIRALEAGNESGPVRLGALLCVGTCWYMLDCFDLF